MSVALGDGLKQRGSIVWGEEAYLYAVPAGKRDVQSATGVRRRVMGGELSALELLGSRHSPLPAFFFFIGHGVPECGIASACLEGSPFQSRW